MNIVYLHGFASGPSSSKAQFFARKFVEAGIPMEIPDLAAGDFEHLTLTGQLDVLHRTVAGREVVLIGSSMGGYLAALYAVRHSNVSRLVLLAPAFAFARRWAETLGEDAVAKWARSGRLRVFHYAKGVECDLHYSLLPDAARYEEFPRVRQPTLVFHGRNDTVVPLALSEEFASRNPGVRVIALESGHELTDVVEEIWREMISFLQAPDAVHGKSGA